MIRPHDQGPARNFKSKVVERAERDPAFAQVLLDEAALLFRNGKAATARLVLRDLIGADFECGQRAASHQPTGSAVDLPPGERPPGA